MNQLHPVATASERGGASIRTVLSVAARHGHPARGGLLLTSGAGLSFLLMAYGERVPFAVVLGIAFASVSAWGALDLARAFTTSRPAASSTTFASFAPALGNLLLAGLVFLASLVTTERGLLPAWAGGPAITVSFASVTLAIFDAARRLGLYDDARPLVRRHGLWLVLISAALYLPTLGVPSLNDPWETHYGEVAREILMRSEWISLWWAHQGFFYSKPVFIFWAQAISMALLRVNVHPGEVLLNDARPEWALRLPNALLAIVALYVLYRGVARAFGRRAGFLGALVLATSAHWFLLAHQSITDMAYVAPMCAAMGLLLLGLHTGETTLAKVHEIRFGSRSIGLSAWHLVFGAILLCALPQSLYLLSRNVELVLGGAGPHGFRFHWDEFASGSGGGNCHLAGQLACGVVTPVHHFEPFAQALVWLAGTFALVWINRGEDRLRRLYILGGWFFAAIATLAKGPAGLGLPVLCGLACIAASRRWKALVDMEVVSGLLIVGVVALPWYIAAFVRHGTAFTDELIFNDMINRAFSHVHDTNEGADTSLVYYVSQLGWGLFPWVGLVPLGIAGWLRGRGEGARAKEEDGSVLLAVWLFLAFTLFTMMGTKFHHYIFPAVPPAAMLLGVALDRAFGPLLDRSRKVIAPPNAEDEHFGRMVGASAIGGAALLALVGHDLARHVAGESDGAIHFIELTSYQYHRAWPVMLDFHGTLLAFTAAGALLLVAAASRKARTVALGGFFGLAALFAVWCGDVYFTQVARHWGQGDVMRAYYAHRDSDAEPLAAYQMNWKGENFYSGNKLALFVSSGAPLTQWVKEQKEKGTKVAFFVTEWTRIGGLKREVTARAWSEVTRKEDSHQFILMRAEL